MDRPTQFNGLETFVFLAFILGGVQLRKQHKKHATIKIHKSLPVSSLLNINNIRCKKACQHCPPHPALIDFNFPLPADVRLTSTPSAGSSQKR
jgi:hypothetical protein